MPPRCPKAREPLWVRRDKTHKPPTVRARPGLTTVMLHPRWPSRGGATWITPASTRATGWLSTAPAVYGMSRHRCRSPRSMIAPEARAKQRGVDAELFASLNRTPPRPPRGTHSPVTLQSLARPSLSTTSSSVGATPTATSAFADESRYSTKSSDKLKRTCSCAAVRFVVPTCVRCEVCPCPCPASARAASADFVQEYGRRGRAAQRQQLAVRRPARGRHSTPAWTHPCTQCHAHIALNLPRCCLPVASLLLLLLLLLLARRG
jgi:hypothetical protein